MSDIVDDLMMRRADGTLFNPSGPTAADTIGTLRAEVERLKGHEAANRLNAKQVAAQRAEVERLRAALEPFAKAANRANLIINQAPTARPLNTQADKQHRVATQFKAGCTNR